MVGTPVIPALVRWRWEEDQKFRVILDYTSEVSLGYKRSYRKKITRNV